MSKRIKEQCKYPKIEQTQCCVAEECGFSECPHFDQAYKDLMENLRYPYGNRDRD